MSFTAIGECYVSKLHVYFQASRGKQKVCLAQRLETKIEWLLCGHGASCMTQIA